MPNNSPILSVIILNYNSGGYLKKCLDSIGCSKTGKYNIEIIVADNNSSDNSYNSVTNFKSSHKLIEYKFLQNGQNLGFAAGNNRGLKLVHPNSKYVLFLNPDTTVETDTFQKIIDFFEKNKNVDGATCYINLALTGKMQPECHRGFPTPWRSLCHFTGISKLLKGSKTFDGYFLGHLDTSKTHKIEACVGAFLMVKKEVGAKIGWWNEKYFFYGEDLDFCYQMKAQGLNLYFYPGCRITHYQGVSSGIVSHSRKITQASRQTKLLVAKASTDAMKIFYENNLLKNYSLPTRYLVLAGIKLLETYRLSKAKYL